MEAMKEKILANLDNPRQLEDLYRSNRASFRRDFNAIYSEIKGDTLAEFGHERLNFGSDDLNWETGKELLFILVATLVAGFIAKIPHLFEVDDEFFYPRNLGFYHPATLNSLLRLEK